MNSCLQPSDSLSRLSTADSPEQLFSTTPFKKMQARVVRQEQAVQIISSCLKKWISIRKALRENLSSLVIASQVKISRRFKLYQAQKHRSQGLLKVTIQWEPKPIPPNTKSQQVQIIGTFSEKHWETPIDLMWCSDSLTYRADVLMPSGALFKFIVDGEFKISNYYPTAYEGKHLNNKFYEFAKLAKHPKGALHKANCHLPLQTAENRKHQCLLHLDSSKSGRSQSITSQEVKIQHQKVQYNIYQCLQPSDNKPSLQRQMVKKHKSGRPFTHKFKSEDSQRLIFVGSGITLPKNHNSNSGEDALFVTESGVGVSDGVGGWRAYGIDCSHFSQSLMQESQRFIQRSQLRSNSQNLLDFKISRQEFECHKQSFKNAYESFDPNASMISSSSEQSDSSSSIVSYCSNASFSKKAINQDHYKKTPTLCPKSILQFSLRRTHCLGSATSSICVLNDKTLTALNLGDSGFLLIRFDPTTQSPYILLRSKEQTHSFNTPFQVANLPNQQQLAQMSNNLINNEHNLTDKQIQSLRQAIESKKFWSDSPDDADIYQVNVREGDLLILGTDGLFDNLFEFEILATLKKFISKQIQGKRIEVIKGEETATQLARELAQAAKVKSLGQHVQTPYLWRKYQLSDKNKQQQQNGHKNQQMGLLEENEDIEEVSGDQYQQLQQQYGKGKADDITVVVTWVTKDYQ